MVNTLHHYLHWLHGFPLWAQMIITAFWCVLPVAITLTIWAGHSDFMRAAPRLKAWHMAALSVVVFYLREDTAWGRQVLGWPDQHVPVWHTYWLAICLGAVLAWVLAIWIGRAYTALRRQAGRMQAADDSFTGGAFAAGWPPSATADESWED